MKKALLLVDLQNDYFPDGLYPLWNTEQTLENILAAMAAANVDGTHIIHIQHIANPDLGLSPFFNKGTDGAKIHESVKKAAPTAPVIVKEFADSFEKTSLESKLAELDVEELFVCGMMTQNCVTHTAIAKAAETYQVSILADCCTTVDEMIHNIALHAVSTRVPLVSFREAL